MDLGTPLRGVEEVRAHGRAKVEQCRSNCRERVWNEGRVERRSNPHPKAGDRRATLAMTNFAVIARTTPGTSVPP
jgi:hypothetical protein